MRGEKVALPVLVMFVRRFAVFGKRRFRVDSDDAVVRQADDEIRPRATALIRDEGLLQVEVAELAHPRELDAPFERALAPRSAHRGRLERIREARGLALSRLLRREQRADLLLQPAVAFV